VSAASAKQDYGVVVGDLNATVQLRDDMRVSRAPLPMFDRGEKFRALLSQGKVSLEVPDDEPLAFPGHSH